MKTGIVLTLLLVFSLSDADGHGRHPGVVAVFHESLSPHGEWVYFGHNVHAWRPAHVFHGWQPYTVGRWVWTIEGWYWESDEPWGWATYHYGRWAHDDYYGWVWIPDLEWGPAWVEWRSGPSCVGWAPLRPHGLVHFSFGLAWAPRAVPVNHWVFVDYGHMTKHKIHHHLLASKDKKKYYEQTDGTPSGDRRTFGNVPDRRDVERRGKVRVTETKVRKETVEQKRTEPGRVAPSPRIVDRNEEQQVPRTNDRRVSTPERVSPDRTQVNRGRAEVPRSDGRIVEKGEGWTDRGVKDDDDSPARTGQSGQRVAPGR